jgi:DNA polymerase III subunit alpha
MNFTHLHVHSHYSLLDGLPKIDQILDYLEEKGMNSMALTDHGNIYGAVEFYEKALKRGIKPIIGCEIYTALDKMSDKRPGIDDKRYHLVLLVKNKEGYKNLVKLITEAHLKGFYYKPRVDEELLSKHAQGLVCLSACIVGKIPQLVLANKMEEAEKTALKYQQMFGKDSFYLEIQNHPNFEEQAKVNKGLVLISKKTNIPLVATNDVHYLRPEDAEAQDILMLINTGADRDNPERKTLKKDNFSMKPPEQMAKEFKDFPEAIKNTQKITELCNFDFELGKTRLPSFDVPEKETPESYLRKLCLQGLKEKFGKNPKKEIIERLDYELSVINKTGFASYFLIVQDLVNWAKENRIVVGPGRGSVGGSLAAFLLKITSIDPLKHHLLFERFLNPGRVSGLPDIDLDFTDRRRDEVIRYVEKKYGENKVAQIITFGTMAARAVIRDVGRAMGYPYNYCDHMAKMIPFGMDLNETIEKVAEFNSLYKSDQQAEKLIDIAKKLEGVVRHASTHACGIVIASDPLDEIVPLQHPTQNDQAIVTQYEMHSVEKLGLLKMDFLGLKNLTIIEDTLARIYSIHKKNIDIEKINKEDKKVYELLQKGNTVGVFQFESSGMQRYLKQLKPTEFEDIIAMVALYRPGPMQLIPDYIARKQKKQKIEYFHPKLKPILEKTYGFPVYQEQIMRIANEMAGFSLAESDVLRKAIGKKIKKLLVAQKEKFIKGCQENKVDKSIALKVWHWIEPFASYSFNRSHAAAYATIAYQTAFLKTHYPAEFMSSLLTSERNDIERIGFLIDSCKKMKLEILPPDINESFTFFSVVPEKKQIRFGLSAIKNVGFNIVETIVKERKEKGDYSSISDFVSRINSRDLNKKSMESLIKAGVFDKMAERNRLLSNLDRLLEYSREKQKAKINGQGGLFDGLNSEKKEEVKLSQTTPASEKEKLMWEKDLLGLFISSHPLKRFQGILAKKTTPISNIQEGQFRRSSRLKIGGIVSRIKKIITKTGKPMLFVDLEDMSGRIEVVVFPSYLEDNQTIFEENKIAIISGRLDFRDETPKLICENAEEIIEK